MANLKCNACGGTYNTTQRDGTAYFHQCPAEIITTPASSTASGAGAGEVREQRTAIRDENIRRGIVYVDGKPHKFVPNPEERNQSLLVPGEAGIISEGDGVSQLD